jgi:hypothetical protein
MRSRSASLPATAVLAAVVTGTVGWVGAGPAHAQDRPRKVTTKPEADPRAADRATLATASEAFVKAYDAGDAKALASCSPTRPRALPRTAP